MAKSFDIDKAMETFNSPVTPYLSTKENEEKPTAKEIKKAGGEKSTPAEKKRSQSKLESKKAVKDKRINLVLSQKLYDDLVTRAEEQGLSYSAYIRHLIAQDIKEG